MYYLEYQFLNLYSTKGNMKQKTVPAKGTAAVGAGDADIVDCQQAYKGH